MCSLLGFLHAFLIYKYINWVGGRKDGKHEKTFGSVARASKIKIIYNTEV